MSAPAAAQRLRAIHLYRQSLRTVLSWCVHRSLFYEELGRMRDEFEKYRGVTDAATVDGLLARGEARLAEYRHPDKYTVPYVYGGSKYARNPPVPADVHVIRDYGRDFTH